MLTSLRLENFRGVAVGELTGLTEITVLVGANGSGKSTILDGLLLAASAAPGDAVGRIVRRRSEALAAANWLGHRGWRDPNCEARVTIGWHDGARRSSTCRLEPEVTPELEAKLIRRRSSGPYREISCVTEDGAGVVRARTVFGADNQYKFLQRGGSTLPARPSVWLVEPQPGGLHSPLSELYTRTAKAGQARLKQAEAWIAEVVPGLERIENLTEPGNTSVVYLIFADHSVPVGLAGDGIQALVRIAFELAVPPGDTVLIEEPEAHQHPRALYYTAQAIAAAHRRGIQVILSTHSLELIDQLLLVLSPDEYARLSVEALRLSSGLLSATRYGGLEARDLRTSLGEDFR